MTEDEKALSVTATAKRSNRTCSRSKKESGCPKNDNVPFVYFVIMWRGKSGSS